MLNRSWTLAVFAAAALALGACQEDLVGGNACPQLCPEQQLGFKDTVFLASEVIDTMVTLPGIPSIGTENEILIARYARTGDSVVSVGVFRFDTLTRGYQAADTTVPFVPFTSVDSAALFLTVFPPPTGQDSIFVQDTVTFLAYSVYVNAPDLDTAPVHAKFAGVPVGSVTLPRDSVAGTVRIPIDSAFLTQQITAGNRVWLGVTVVSKGNVRVGITTVNGEATLGGSSANMRYCGHADTLKVCTGVTVKALATPYGPAIPDLSDYQMVFKGSAPVPPGMLGVGGLPSNRVFVRFKFPAWLVDSSTTVVRANLELHQAPFTGFRVDSDSVVMAPVLVVASPAVTDLPQAAVLVDLLGSLVRFRTFKLPPAGISLDSLALVRSGILANVFVFWRGQGNKVQRSIVFAMVGEGLEPRQLLFYGVNASPALRPQVHVSYVPHASIGLP